MSKPESASRSGGEAFAVIRGIAQAEYVNTKATVIGIQRLIRLGPNGFKMSDTRPPQTLLPATAPLAECSSPSRGYISESPLTGSGAAAHYVVIDAGHRYELFSLDGAHQQELRFVKRFDLGRPWRFPGNTSRYPGTTLQGVLRVLIHRVLYLQGQIWAVENAAILKLLRLSLWLLEFRAARRHGRSYWHGITFAATASMCAKCGHTACDHSGALAPATQEYN